MLAATAVLAASCGGGGESADGSPESGTPASSLHVSSPDWPDGGALRPPTACAHHGDHGRSPALRWTQGPPGTKYYDITVVDPDADHFLHWAALNLPASDTSLAAGKHDSAKELRNDFGYTGYGAPCPPKGTTHHYVLTVWALPQQASSVAELSKHALASTKVTAAFGP